MTRQMDILSSYTMTIDPLSNKEAPDFESCMSMKEIQGQHFFPPKEKARMTGTPSHNNNKSGDERKRNVHPQVIREARFPRYFCFWA